MAKRKHQTDRKQRRGAATGDRRSNHWLFGVHPVLAALSNPSRQCRRLVWTKEVAARLGERLPPGAPAPELLERGAIERLLGAASVHQGIALQAEPLAELSLTELCGGIAPDGRATVLVLDQVTDPRNVGAALRAAAAFGARAVVVTERNAPPAGGAMAKAAAGALETLPLIRAKNLARALVELKKNGFWCLGLDADADKALDEIDAGGRLALVLGAEGAGLRRLTREACDMLVRIPTTGAMQSLNVAAAAAVALYALTQ